MNPKVLFNFCYCVLLLMFWRKTAVPCIVYFLYLFWRLKLIQIIKHTYADFINIYTAVDFGHTKKCKMSSTKKDIERNLAINKLHNCVSHQVYSYQIRIQLWNNLVRLTWSTNLVVLNCDFFKCCYKRLYVNMTVTTATVQSQYVQILPRSAHNFSCKAIDEIFRCQAV